MSRQDVDALWTLSAALTCTTLPDLSQSEIADPACKPTPPLGCRPAFTTPADCTPTTRKARRREGDKCVLARRFIAALVFQAAWARVGFSNDALRNISGGRRLGERMALDPGGLLAFQTDPGLQHLDQLLPYDQQWGLDFMTGPFLDQGQQDGGRNQQQDAEHNEQAVAV